MFYARDTFYRSFEHVKMRKVRNFEKDILFRKTSGKREREGEGNSDQVVWHRQIANELYVIRAALQAWDCDKWSSRCNTILNDRDLLNYDRLI